MRAFLVGAILGVCFGAAGVLVFRPPVPPSQRDAIATPARPASATSRPAEPTLTGWTNPDAALPGRLASVEAELRRVADALAALTNGAAAGAPAATSSQAPAGAADTAEVEQALRRTWSAALDEMAERLRSSGPPDSSDPALWSRWDDIRRARSALAEAQSLADLRRLAEGEFKRTFKLP